MWQGIFGHDDVIEQFRQVLLSGRLASTYLFVGPPGIGKRKVALELGHALLCTESPEPALQPCGRCESCRLFTAGSHPDLDVVSLPADKTMLPIALFIGDDQHRNQEGLCHRIAMKPFYGRRRIAIVDDADHFSIPSANCLLKTLEEPPPSAVLILIGTSPSRQLPTIRSRSQIVRFRPLDKSIVAKVLLESGLIADAAQAATAAEMSNGSIERALQFGDPALGKFQEQLVFTLQSPILDRVQIGRAVQEFVEDAGKEASLRRDRLRAVIGFAIDFYRNWLRISSPKLDCANECLDDAEPIIKALDGCLDAIANIDRNANQALLIQVWCKSLVPVNGLDLAARP